MIRSVATLITLALLVCFAVVPLFLIDLVIPQRRLVFALAAFIARTLLRICGLRLTVEDAEGARESEPNFYVGNHQSALDIMILIAALRGRARFIAKDSLFRIPVFGWVLSRYGHVPLDRSHPRAARERLNRLLADLKQDPMSFVVFPEGTRSAGGQLLPFRKGAMRICHRAGLAVVPFSIDGSGRVGPPNQLRLHPGPVRLRFGEPIPAGEVVSMSPTELHDRVREQVAEGLGLAGEELANAAQMVVE